MQKRWFKTKKPSLPSSQRNEDNVALSSKSYFSTSSPLPSAEQPQSWGLEGASGEEAPATSKKREGLSSGLDLSPLGKDDKRQKIRSEHRPQSKNFEAEREPTGNSLKYYNDRYEQLVTFICRAHSMHCTWPTCLDRCTFHPPAPHPHTTIDPHPGCVLMYSGTCFQTRTSPFSGCTASM
jgi:hypothetical protein